MFVVSGYENWWVDYEFFVLMMLFVFVFYLLCFDGLGMNEDCGMVVVVVIEKVIEDEGFEIIVVVIGELVIGFSGGVIVFLDNYWLVVCDICDKYGIFFIFDEVMIGFGCMGSKFVCEYWELKFDILVFGKGLVVGYVFLLVMFVID